jgi:hypothetical protein
MKNKLLSTTDIQCVILYVNNLYECQFMLLVSSIEKRENMFDMRENDSVNSKIIKKYNDSENFRLKNTISEGSTRVHLITRLSCPVLCPILLQSI